VRIRLKPRWLEERKVYFTSGPAPGYLQNGTGPKLRTAEVFILRKAAASKQGVQKQTIYHVSTAVDKGHLQFLVGSLDAGALARGRALLVFDPFSLL
jgi:hypothetical protein